MIDRLSILNLKYINRYVDNKDLQLYFQEKALSVATLELLPVPSSGKGGRLNMEIATTSRKKLTS